MSENEPAFDEERQLCDDGNCLGVVVDGKCNVCGLAGATATTSPRDPSSGQSGSRSPRDPSSGLATTSPRDPSSGQSGASAMVSEGGHTDEAFDDEERQLCSDGACTGLLGSDGKCKECGRSAAS